jgi:hypothetical protein
MAVSMIGLAIEVFYFPKVLEAVSFETLVNLMPGKYIGWFILFFGIVRLGALIANGRSVVHGPRIRAIAAIAGAVLWAQFSFSIIVNMDNYPLPSPTPNLPFWLSFIFAEIYSAYRAAIDVRN